MERDDLLVGREREMATLDRLVDRAYAGRGGTMVVLGDAGIGKTAVVETLAGRAAKRGVVVVWGRCTEVDAPVFWPWRQALGSLGIDVLDADSAVARPELFARVLDRLGARTDPVVVVLEDLHWADEASTALLRFVVDALPDVPMALVATARDVHVPPAFGEWLGSLPPAIERLRLTGLDGPAIAELITGVLGYRPPPEVTDRIARRSGGNPFFAREVAQLHAHRGTTATVAVPAAVQQVLERRLAPLAPPCVELIECAAVAGRPDPEVVAAVVRRSPAEVLDGFGQAISSGLLVADGPDVDFAHDLVREVTYQQIAVADRWRLHRRTAEALTDLDADGYVGEIASHWRRAGTGAETRRQAATWALAAARAARQRGGYERAAQLYGWALETPVEDRLGIVIELGETQLVAGAFTEGRATLDTAVSDARRAGRCHDTVRAVLAAGLGGFEVAMYDPAMVSILAEAIAGLDPADDDVLRAAALARLSLISAGQRSDADRVALAEASMAIAQERGDGAIEVEALAAWCDARAGPDHIDDRLEHTRTMQVIARRCGEVAGVLLAGRLHVLALAEHGDFAALDAQTTAYQQAAERLRLPVYTWIAHLWRAARALMAGDLDAARRHAETAEELGARAGSVNAATLVTVHRLWLYAATGEHDRLAATVDHLITLIPPEHPQLSCLAGCYVQAGQLDGARRLLYRPDAPDIDALPKDAEYLIGLWLLADAAIALDDHDIATRLYDALEPYAHRWAIDGMMAACAGHVSHQLGRLAHHLGHRDHAERWLHHALHAHQAAGAPLLTAATQHAIDSIHQTGNVPTTRSSSTPVSAVFARNGRVWQLTWNGTTSTVPDSKGMRDLATLLAAPSRDVHALDLVETAGGPPASAAGGHAGEHLDHTARTAYRRRLTELDTELTQAEADADLARTEHLRHEHDLLTAELTSALGLGGRPRTTGDPIERARKAVAMRIRTALRAIGEVDPALAHHLDRSVTTGRFCTYQPEHPINWQLTLTTWPT